MTLFEALWLGIVQGATEFLPISSSGHLVFFQQVFGLQQPMLAFDVLLHVGSLIAVTVFYRERLWQMLVSLWRPSRAPAGRRLILMIVVATAPAAVIGPVYGDFLSGQFDSLPAVGFHWLLTAALLFAASRLRDGQKDIEGITASDALLIGLFQAMAILPGVSRSGATIAAAMMCGVRGGDAAAFSFLISVPAIIGASLAQLGDWSSASGSEWGIYLAGAAISAAVSYAAIWLLIRLLQRRVIRPFAWYCITASAVTVVVMLARP